MKRFVASLLTAFLSTSAMATESQLTTTDDGISKGRYITGGIVGSVAGFGIGHAIQGRYRKRHAWIFTTAESVAVGFTIMSTFFACEGPTGDDLDRCRRNVNRRVAAGQLVFWSFHVWEIIDVWTGVKIREEAPKQVYIMPTLFDRNSPGLSVALWF